jgi:SAM-dependent methyltransferase
MSKSKPLNGTEGYAEEAEALTVRYERLTLEQVYGDALALFPKPPASVLDIGAGTGRDAAALAARGHKVVVAVEPTRELREHGQKVHAAHKIKWLDDGLPDLDKVLDLERRYDLVLLSAVWMHLDKDQRRAAMAGVASLTEPGGRIVLSLRHGPVPEGRRMFPVTPAETVALAEGQGFSTLYNKPHPDVQGRDGVSWTWLVFERPRSD